MIKNNSGQTLLSVIISFALLTILLLGLSSVNTIVAKSFKNISLDFDTQLETIRVQQAFADLGKACQKTFAGSTFTISASGAAINDIHSLNYADPPNGPGGTIIVEGLISNNIDLSDISVVEIKSLNANNTLFFGKLRLTYQKHQNVSFGTPTLRKQFPLFIQATTSGTTATIVDCATTSNTLSVDIQATCSSITLDGTPATWNPTTKRCVIP